MSNKAAALLFGLLGIACGVAVSCRLFEQKYKNLADEEIASVKKTFARRNGSVSETPMPESAPAAADEKRVDYSRIKSDTVYKITEEQFGEFEDYEKISLTYFSDGVLTSDDYEKITPDLSNVDSGKKLDLYFADKDIDVVYIRNDETSTDYEIARDERTYDEVCLSRPYLRRE